MMVSATLAEYLSGLNYDALPEPVVRQARRCLLDYLGVALAGAATVTAGQVRQFLQGFPGVDGVTVIGMRHRTDVLKAALANGMLAHALELDDGDRRAAVHPGAVVCSAVLPLAEQESIDGRRLLTGIVAGYEAALRVGRAVQPEHRARGFHATGTCGTLGAAVAVAVVRGASTDELARALGLGATSASGLLQFLEDGSQIKHYHAGKAALCGVLAADLARCGLTAPVDILEGKRGFFQALGRQDDAAACIRGLGDDFAIQDIYVKPYAACRHAHAPIEAVLTLRQRHDLKPERLDRITVTTYHAAVDGHQDPAPRGTVGATMSTPYSVAVALCAGRAGPREFAGEMLQNAQVLDLAGRVTVVEDAALTALVPERRPAIVTVRTVDGQEYSHRVDLPRGEPENPVSAADLERKFRDLAGVNRSAEVCDRIVQVVAGIENRIGALFPLLR